MRKTQTDIHTQINRHRQTEKETERHRNRQTRIQSHTLTDKQTDRHRDCRLTETQKQKQRDTET